MNKKTLFSIFIIIAVMIATFAAAIPMPLPIDGRITGSNVDGQKIIVTNLRTNKVLETNANAAGEWLVDWANSDDEGGAISRVMNGDQFKIIIDGCKDNAACVKTVTYSGQDELFIPMDVTGTVLKCAACPVCRSGSCNYNCPTNTCHCPSTSCPEPTIQYVEKECPSVQCPEARECPGQTICQECPAENVCPAEKICPVCDESYKNIGIAAISALLLIIVTIGGGIKVYKNKLGKAVLQHTHTGVTGYHDPNTRHENPKYRHRSWNKDPMGCLEDVAKINSNGGL